VDPDEVKCEFGYHINVHMKQGTGFTDYSLDLFPGKWPVDPKFAPLEPPHFPARYPT